MTQLKRDSFVEDQIGNTFETVRTNTVTSVTEEGIPATATIAQFSAEIRERPGLTVQRDSERARSPWTEEAPGDLGRKIERLLRARRAELYVLADLQGSEDK